MAVSECDLRAMVDIARDPGDEFGAYGMPTAVLVGLKSLVSCDVISFCQYNAEEPARSFDQSLPVEAADWDGIARAPVESPGIWCPASRADFVTVVKVSDFYGRREFHASSFHAEYLTMGGLGDCEHLMVLPFADLTGGTLNVFLFRSRGPDFSERDRAVLTLLQPHVLRSFHATEDRRRGRIALTPGRSSCCVWSPAATATGTSPIGHGSPKQLCASTWRTSSSGCRSHRGPPPSPTPSLTAAQPGHR
jgi:hypothetical protein